MYIENTSRTTLLLNKGSSFYIIVICLVKMYEYIFIHKNMVNILVYIKY